MGMKFRMFLIFLSLHVLFVQLMDAQNSIDKKNSDQTTPLFEEQDLLTLKLKFSIKNVKYNTNDSTYLNSILYYKNASLAWDSLDVKLRARGQHRRENCYFTPLKLKLKKSSAKGTVFKGNEKLKVVLPCSANSTSNDYIVKEYLAYKLYEIISPYHFKTRLVDIELIQEKGQRSKTHFLKGILIEDIDKVEKRFNAREYKRLIHPFAQDDRYSINLAFFQYLIANTDFSTHFQHNVKLLFIDTKYISIPYDFDMSGLVNTNYSAVSGIDNLSRKIQYVTQRLYKGYKRDPLLFEETRQYFLSHKNEILNTIDGLNEFFINQNQIPKTKKFLMEFYDILENDKKFTDNIISQTRTK
mgnify:CR=1 FL=1|jgi:hypothetical protein